MNNYDNPNIVKEIMYEYANAIQEITNNKISSEYVFNKLTYMIKCIRFGKWRDEDYYITYDNMSVINPLYRKTIGKTFGAQTIEYFDDYLYEAIILYDKNDGVGIDLNNINDIRQTLYHEFTHVMSRTILNKSDKKYISGRCIINTLNVGNINYTCGIETLEIDNNKLIHHNQIDEGVVEYISRLVMNNVLKSFELLNSNRYETNIKYAKKLMSIYGKDDFIYEYLINSNSLINNLEDYNNEDILNYYSNLLNDEIDTNNLIKKIIKEFDIDTYGIDKDNLYFEDKNDIYNFIIYHSGKDINIFTKEEQELIDELCKKILKNKEQKKSRI